MFSTYRMVAQAPPTPITLPTHGTMYLTVNVFNTSSTQQHDLITMPPVSQTLLANHGSPSSPDLLPTPTSSYLPYQIFQISTGVIMVIYATIVTKLLLFKKYIERTDTWASWRSDIPLAALQELSPEDVAYELRNTIEDRYTAHEKKISPENQSITFYLIAACINDIDHEISRINQFLTICHWIKTLHMSMCFPKQKKSIEKATAALNRLIFLKKVINHIIIK